MSTTMRVLIDHGLSQLQRQDDELCVLLEREVVRQATTLNLVASSCIVDPSIQACQASVLVNVTAEGYPAKRYQGGCQIADAVEQLAIDRAKLAFSARFANVQPHSASVANELLILHFVPPGGTIMGMRLDAGGHLTHGSRSSVTGSRYNAINYGTTPDGLIDYDEVRALALQHRPALLICGTTAYPRRLDFRRFRAIADEAGALLLADITHIAGLVAAGLHESPIEHAHFTTTCTHKQLYGPRGGLILMGSDGEAVRPGRRVQLREEVQRAVFPFFQGAAIMNVIAAKAAAFHRLMRPGFKALAARVQENARDLAAALELRGYRVVSGGTDTHLVLCEVLASRGVSGLVAQRALEQSGISVNKNLIPRDTAAAGVTSGMRLGTNSIAQRNFNRTDVDECVALIDRVLCGITVSAPDQFDLPPAIRDETMRRVSSLCRRRPVEGYPDC